MDFEIFFNIYYKHFSCTKYINNAYKSLTIKQIKNRLIKVDMYLNYFSQIISQIKDILK